MIFFLVGFMGSGKTYLGKIWAAEHGLNFYDLDSIIVEKEERSIKDIFEKDGEDYFRKTEADVLKETINLQNCIIACGGGTACFYNNMAWMKQNGLTIFLNENVERIMNNLKSEKQIRPLLMKLSEAEKYEFVKLKLTERMPFYLQSDIVLTSDELNKEAFRNIKSFIKNK